MKLARKLSFAIMLGVCLVLGVRAYLRALEERDEFRADVKRDHTVLGWALTAVVESVWQREGPERALELVERVNQSEHGAVEIRFVWKNGSQPGEARAPRVPEQIPAVGELTRSVLLEDHDVPHMLSYAALDIPGPRVGALELYEPLTTEREALQRFAERMLVTTLALVGFCAVVIYGFGVIFVARPLRMLVEKTERIGRGDLSGPLSMRQDDEIREVALAMNQMCERLEEAREAAQREERERIKALEQLRHADRLRAVGELASGIAHQMGTPLNVVRVRGAMIASGEVSEARARELGAIIVEQVDRVSGTIRELLDFARRKQPTLMATDVRQLLEQSVRLVEPLATASSVKLVLEVPTEPVEMALDAGQMHQVLINLLVNAVQASPRGERIEVGLARDAREVVISVRDHGEGVPEDQRTQIFEPFFTTKRAGEGTGLGLSVARGIVEEHQGKIEVESAKGQGAVFRVRLPYDRSDAR